MYNKNFITFIKLSLEKGQNDYKLWGLELQLPKK